MTKKELKLYIDQEWAERQEVRRLKQIEKNETTKEWKIREKNGLNDGKIRNSSYVSWKKKN